MYTQRCFYFGKSIKRWRVPVPVLNEGKQYECYDDETMKRLPKSYEHQLECLYTPLHPGPPSGRRGRWRGRGGGAFSSSCLNVLPVVFWLLPFMSSSILPLQVVLHPPSACHPSCLLPVVSPCLTTAPLLTVTRSPVLPKLSLPTV